jgi:multidrug efflux pump subunit AcrA (membrane-fusion protein)
MKWQALLSGVVAVFVGFGLIDRRPAATPAETELGEITRGSLVVRSVHQGHLESRHVVTVASRFQGAAVLVELAEEGSTVAPGDLLVRFDTSGEQRDLLQYRTEVTLRAAELAKLIDAEQPIALLERAQQVEEMRRSLAAEARFLAESVELAEEQLVSAAEVARQREKVEGLRQRLAAQESSLELLRAHSHPMERRRAEATLATAREELARAERQIDNATILAPSAGVVVYQPLHLDGEYRTARVGDSVFSNQTFMQILDFSDLVVRIAVPEAERGSVHPGSPALVQPAAHPEIRLAGEVEEISSIAQALPGQPSWQRFFRAAIRLEGGHPQLHPGMSALAHVVTYQAENALQIPRRGVRFAAGEATAHVIAGDGGHELRKLTLGPASECCFEVLAGVESGERVALW